MLLDLTASPCDTVILMAVISSLFPRMYGRYQRVMINVIVGVTLASLVYQAYKGTETLTDGVAVFSWHLKENRFTAMKLAAGMIIIGLKLLFSVERVKRASLAVVRSAFSAGGAGGAAQINEAEVKALAAAMQGRYIRSFQRNQKSNQSIKLFGSIHCEDLSSENREALQAMLEKQARARYGSNIHVALSAFEGCVLLCVDFITALTGLTPGARPHHRATVEDVYDIVGSIPAELREKVRAIVTDAPPRGTDDGGGASPSSLRSSPSASSSILRGMDSDEEGAAALSDSEPSIIAFEPVALSDHPTGVSTLRLVVGPLAPGAPPIIPAIYSAASRQEITPIGSEWSFHRALPKLSGDRPVQALFSQDKVAASGIHEFGLLTLLLPHSVPLDCLRVALIKSDIAAPAESSGVAPGAAGAAALPPVVFAQERILVGSVLVPVLPEEMVSDIESLPEWPDISNDLACMLTIINDSPGRASWSPFPQLSDPVARLKAFLNARLPGTEALVFVATDLSDIVQGITCVDSVRDARRGDHMGPLLQFRSRILEALFDGEWARKDIVLECVAVTVLTCIFLFARTRKFQMSLGEIYTPLRILGLALRLAHVAMPLINRGLFEKFRNLSTALVLIDGCLMNASTVHFTCGTENSYKDLRSALLEYLYRAIVPIILTSFLRLPLHQGIPVAVIGNSALVYTYYTLTVSGACGGLAFPQLEMSSWISGWALSVAVNALRERQDRLAFLERLHQKNEGGRAAGKGRARGKAE